MEKKHLLTLDKDFIDYCTLNKIDDIEKFGKEVFIKGFNLIKYGNRPFITEGKEKNNIKTVTTSNPEVIPAPQPKIQEKNNLYDE